MEKETKRMGRTKAGVYLGTLIGAVIITATVFLANMNVIVEEEPEPVEDTRRWRNIFTWTPTAGEANPGAGASGILEIYFVNHSTTPPFENTTATIEGWAANIGATPFLGWNNTDNFMQQLQHSTTFDIIVRVRGNATHCNRTTFWYTTDLNVTLSCVDLGVGVNTSMTGVATQNGTGSYLWMNFYHKGPGGAGFTLSKGQTVQITRIAFDAYY